MRIQCAILLGMPKPKAVQQKVIVSTRALIARINRKLHPDDRILKATRGARAEFDLGRFFVLDWRISNIVEHHVDLEDLAKELGVLRPWEQLETEAETELVR